MCCVCVFTRKIAMIFNFSIIFYLLAYIFENLFSQILTAIKSWCNDTWYKRWCDYGGSDNRCVRDYRCKIILYWIFVIKTSFDKIWGLFPEIIMSTSQSPFICLKERKEILKQPFKMFLKIGVDFQIYYIG